MPPQTLGTRESLDNCSPEPLIWARGKEKGIFVQKLDCIRIYFLKVFLFGFEKKMELAIWHVLQPSLPCLKMYREHFPGSYCNQFKAEALSLSSGC